MMRLPKFTYRVPRTIAEAVKVFADAGPEAQFVAGGTDLYPNMKRRQQMPKTVISVMRLPELNQITGEGKSGIRIGASVTLTDICENAIIKRDYPVIASAARTISTPILRNMGTIGGNLCLDTRCNYYNQNYEWRKAIDYCLKKDGDICWVATASKRCVAMSSTDCAPALIALGAKVRLVSALGEREIPVEDLYNNDGIEYLKRRADEILTEVSIPAHETSCYWKLRRRGAFDFPVLGVAASLDNSGNTRIALGAVASRPFLVEKASEFLRGKTLTDEVIDEAARLVAARAKPMDNADLDLYWRKDVAGDFVRYALRELRGDDMRETRLRIARYVP